MIQVQLTTETVLYPTIKGKIGWFIILVENGRFLKENKIEDVFNSFIRYYFKTLILWLELQVILQNVMLPEIIIIQGFSTTNKKCLLCKIV